MNLIAVPILKNIIAIKEIMIKETLNISHEGIAVYIGFNELEDECV